MEKAVEAALRRNVEEAILHLNAATKVAAAHGLQVELAVDWSEATLEAPSHPYVDGLVSGPVVPPDAQPG